MAIRQRQLLGYVLAAGFLTIWVAKGNDFSPTHPHVPHANRLGNYGMSDDKAIQHHQSGTEPTNSIQPVLIILTL